MALVAVCSVTFHLKSVQELGEGTRLDDDQLPSSAPLPAADGPVAGLLTFKADAARERDRGHGQHGQQDSILHVLYLGWKADKLCPLAIAVRKKYTSGKSNEFKPLRLSCGRRMPRSVTAVSKP